MKVKSIFKCDRFPLAWLLMIFLSYSGASYAMHPTETKRAVPYDKSRASLENAFSSLASLEVDGAVVAYNARVAKVINKKRSALDREHPLFVKDEFEEEDILLLETQLSGDSRTFYVLFSKGPSADPGFYFISTDSPDAFRYFAAVWGTALILPGNGAVYVANRFNNTFTKRSKYIYSDSGLSEVKQPYYYVGLKTKTLHPITLYASPNERQEVARLPKEYEIEVLLTDNKRDKKQRTCFLIKTSFGLTGWVWVQESQYFSNTIEGISYWGD